MGVLRGEKRSLMNLPPTQKPKRAKMPKVRRKEPPQRENPQPKLKARRMRTVGKKNTAKQKRVVKLKATKKLKPMARNAKRKLTTTKRRKAPKTGMRMEKRRKKVATRKARTAMPPRMENPMKR